MVQQSDAQPTGETNPTIGLKQGIGLDSDFFERFAGNISEGFILFDDQGAIHFFNPAAQLIFNPDGTLSGENLLQFIAHEPLQEFFSQITTLEVGACCPWDFELKLPAGCGQKINLLTWAVVHPDLQQKVYCGLINLQSSDNVVHSNEPNSELQYRSIVEDETDLIFRFRPNGTISYVNEAFCHFWEKERSELIGTNIMASTPKEDRPRIRAQFVSLTPGCPAVTFETRVNLPNGSLRWLQRTDRAIFNQEGKPVEYVSVSHDITARVKVEKALKHQLALEDVVMNISARFINVDPAEIDHEIIRALRILGEFLGVDQCFIRILGADHLAIQKNYAWNSPRWMHAGEPIGEVTSHQHPWAMAKLAHFETIQVSELSLLPPEAALDKEQWMATGIASLLFLPLVQSKQLIGFFGFERMSSTLDWSEDEVGLLKVIGEIFVSVWMRKQSLDALHETQRQLQQRIQELENHTREINLLTEMSNMLQIASEFEEIYVIVANYAQRLLPGMAGSLWIIQPGSSLLALQSHWGEVIVESETLSLDNCWGLRRGRLYHSSGTNPTLFCRHVSPPLPHASLCAPIVVQGKTVGLFHIQSDRDDLQNSGSAQQLAAVTAEQVGLALANLQLRHDLREQAIRDPLTGLYNRYYMETSLEREITRAARDLSPVSLIMLDVDQLRKINDSFGHAGGDRVLAELGKMLRAVVRVGDIASRTGGEEFILILPDTVIETALQRVEQLKDEIRKTSIWFEGRQIAPVTLSVGITCWPQHAHTIYELIRSAASALQQAKAIGPDQIAVTPD